eukprot:8035570-Pyramimonas_sp.AAC.1
MQNTNPHANKYPCEESSPVNGAAKRVRDAATGALGGAPYGATKHVRGEPYWARVAIRTQPLAPSVELPMGPRDCEGCARMDLRNHADPTIGALAGDPSGPRNV